MFWREVCRIPEVEHQTDGFDSFEHIPFCFLWFIADNPSKTNKIKPANCKWLENYSRMRPLHLKRRRLRFAIIHCVISIIVIVVCFWNRKKLSVVVRDVGYLSRPIWDREISTPSLVIPQYYSPNLVNTSAWCELHGWKLRTDPGYKIKVIDAFIFSIELDLLEIRMKELWPVVDTFLVLEATRTFTGKRKELYLQQNLSRFEWAKDKLRTSAFDGLEEMIPAGQSPFFNENRMRKRMAEWIREFAYNGDLVIVSDIDEIPRRQTIQLLRICEGYPSELHLLMKHYMYSFEYPQHQRVHWRPHVAVYNSSFTYSHGHRSDYGLADSGWHCSFCFPHLSDFVFKMTAYSHTDRLTDPHLAEYDAIQRRICNGEDIFNMYPEVYTFKDLFNSLGPIPKTTSIMFVPNYLVENKDRFKYLLPGGCVR